MARLLLTGASGFVGAATLQAALNAGHEVSAVLRPGHAPARLPSFRGRFTPIEADLRDAAAMSGAVAAVRPEAVVHLAWSGVENTARFDRRQINDNLEATCNLVAAAAAAGCRSFIAFGSQGEYGPVDKPVGEEELPRPTTLYGAAKVATLYLARQLAAQSGMHFAWLRLFSTYGPGDNAGWLIPTMIREMLAGRRPKTTLGTQTWDWLYIDDVARAVMALLSKQSTGVYNLGSGKPVQVRRAIEIIRDLAAPGMELVFGEIPFRADQVMHMEADIRKIVAETGWAPEVSLEDGLARTVQWYREHGT